jgi:pimeloyl-ACP methyl ester carboxylesterase
MSYPKDAPVVFINGLIGTLSNPLIHKELGGRASLAPDLLGYGALSNTSQKITIPVQVERIREELDERFAERKVHLVGHSVGGVVAYLFAQRYPHRVASIISVEGNFTLNDAFWSSCIAHTPLEEVKAILAEYQRDPIGWLKRAGIPGEPDFLSMARAWLANQPASTLRAMARSVVAITSSPDFLSNLKQLFADVPVHLIAGERSADSWDIPDWAVHTAVSRTIMPHTGHLMMLEDPAAFGRVIAGLLD